VMEIRTRSRAIVVIGAGAVVAVLAGALGLRLAAGAGGVPPAPAAAVPLPRPVQVEALTVPCWSCPNAKGWPVRFQTDLDLLAPLGTGPANAAVWFKDFAKPGGRRYAEAESALTRRVDAGDVGRVLAGDDPLLLEAEPWCDQATMRFYPGVFPQKGIETQLPNLLLDLTFARSWIARGERSADPEKALADFRRVVRLGRLLRQEDAIVMNDLVGLACIRIGAEAIYGLAAKRGDTPLMLAAAIVQGESAPQRLTTAALLTKLDLAPFVTADPAGGMKLELSDRKLDEIVAVATASPDLRFRAEALVALNVVRYLGTPVQRENALSVLNRLAATTDSENLAALAAWSRDTRRTEQDLRTLKEPLPKS
jgi:hypothetical protein